MGLMGCPESLQATNNACYIPLPAEQKPELHHSRSPKSCKDEILLSCRCQDSSSVGVSSHAGVSKYAGL